MNHNEDCLSWGLLVHRVEASPYPGVWYLGEVQERTEESSVAYHLIHRAWRTVSDVRFARTEVVLKAIENGGCTGLSTSVVLWKRLFPCLKERPVTHLTIDFPIL